MSGRRIAMKDYGTGTWSFFAGFVVGMAFMWLLRGV